MKRLFAMLRAALSIGALVAVLMHADARQAVALLREATIPWLGVALVCNCAAVVLSTLLWRALMVGSRPRLARLLCAYLEGMFFNNAGMGTVFGDASRVEALVSEGSRVRGAVTSVVAERLLSLLALLALSSGGAFLLVGDHLALAITVWVASASCFMSVIMFALWGSQFTRFHGWPSWMRSTLGEASSAVVSLRRRPRSLVIGGALALAVQCCTVLATMAVLRSLGQDLSIQAAFLTVPVIALCVSLPFSIQGIGVREVAYVYVLSAAGVAAEVAVTAALLSFSLTLVVSVGGGLIVLWRGALSIAGRGRRDGGAPMPQRCEDVEARAA